MQMCIRRKELELSKQNLENSVNNASAVVAILSDYAPLVKARALLFTSDICELEDLIQEGNIGLLSAASSYNNNLSAFSTFARRCIDASIIDYLRKNQKSSRVPQQLLVDINDFDIPDSSLNPEQTVAVKEEYSNMLSDAEVKLSGLEYSVFVGLLRGDSHAEIAEKNSVEIKAVRNAVQRIRAKLK